MNIMIICAFSFSSKVFRLLSRSVVEVEIEKVENWTFDICIAHFSENSPLKRSEWHVLTRDHRDLPAIHMFIHK